MTLAKTGILTLTSNLVLSNGEVISEPTDDTVRVASNDTHTVLEVYSPYATNGTAALNLVGDAQADATDSFQIKNNADGTLTFGNDSTAAGTYLTKLTLSSAGVLTLVDSETLTNSSDALILTGDDNDTALRVIGFEAKEARLQLNADQDDDATDGWEIASSTAGTLTFGNDSSAAGTYLDKLTLSSAGVITLVDGETITNASDVVTIGADDAAASLVVSGFEANAASITIQSDEGDDAADKFIMSMSAADVFTMTTGATEAISIASTGIATFNADPVIAGTTPLLTIGDAGEEDAAIKFDGAAVDFSIGLDDTADSLSISLGSALGTTEVMNMDGTTVTVTDKLTASDTFTANGAIAAGYEMVTTSAADPGVGAASVTKLFTAITSDETGSAADDVSLAAGSAGQMKIITLAVDGETAGTNINANFAGATATALLEDAGDTLVLVSDGTEWYIVYNNGATLS